MGKKKFQDKSMLTVRTVVMILIIVGVGTYAALTFASRETGPDPRAGFAACLSEKGATFYGAYWCPHCSEQKKRFGKAFSQVNYVECAVPGNPRAQTQRCQDDNITGYPTWVFADGSRANGVQSFEALAEKTGCPLPETAE